MVGSLVDSTAKATRSDESSMSAISAVTSATPWVSRNGLNSLLTTIALLLSWGAASGALPCVSHVGTAERSVSGSNDIQGAEHVPALLGPKIKRLASAQVPNRSTGKSDWHDRGGPRPAARDSRPRRRSPSWPRERDPRLRQRGEACPAVAPEE